MLLPHLDRALPVAQRAIDTAVQHVQRSRPTRVKTKSDRNLVTNVDVTVELQVRKELHAWDPGLGFLGEEHGPVGDQETYWVLDPIDGTTNFVHGNPLCAIALALVHDGRPVLGITALPFLGQRYWATDGNGACRDGKPVAVTTTCALPDALIGLSDYGSGPDAAIRDRVCAELDVQLTATAQGLRRLGSTAVDLVWVAEGRLDACVLIGNSTWDTAAGAVIAREAGALVLDADGTEHTTRSRCLVATTPALADSVLPLMTAARGTPYWP